MGQSSAATPPMTLPPDAQEIVRKYALQNAVQHLGKADPKSIVGRVLAAEASLRPHAKELAPLCETVVASVNALAPDAQRKELESLDPKLLEKQQKERKEGFKRLPDDEVVPQIVMRFAPNPNGPATIGHSRGMVIHAEYQRMYREMGKPFKMILRYDDTDPSIKRPMLEAYHSLLEDFAWLGGRPDLVFAASERVDEYYKVAGELLEKGKAYICECEAETFKALKDAGEACPHRGRSIAENVAGWKKMLDGGYQPGQAVLRIPTDIKHPDPALRDWVAFRIVVEPHPRVGAKYRVWPMLDFESAVEDHLQGVTHIVRGKDLIDSERKQLFVYQFLGWAYPKTLHWGRVKIHEFGKVSKSLFTEGIAAGKYTGWDDVRLPTLAALRRRGFTAEALRNFWIGLGLTERDVAVSMENVEAENRKLVEKAANRYFFVEDPAKVHLTGLPKGGIEGHAPLHPDDPKRGTRRVRLGDATGAGDVYLAAPDVQNARNDEVFRLKDWGNVKFLGEGRAEYAGNDLAILRAGARIVQWVSAAPNASVPVRVHMPDEAGTVKKGLAEVDSVRDFGRLVQFERFGFVRLERQERGVMVAAYAHP